MMEELRRLVWSRSVSYTHLRAHETLHDEGKRKAYDLIYPSIINRTQTKFQKPLPQPPRSTRASTSHSKAGNEAAQIASLRQAKEDRNIRWRVTQTALEASIFELRRSIRWLEQEIQHLASIDAAELSTAACEKSRGTRILSPLYKHVKESEEAKALKQEVRQQRRAQKDLTERRLSVQQAALSQKETQLRAAKTSFDTENLRDDQSIRDLEATKRRSEALEEQQERLAKIRRQQREHQAKMRKQHQEQQQAQSRQYEQDHERERKARQDSSKAEQDSLEAQAEARAAEWAEHQEEEWSQGPSWNDLNPDSDWESVHQPHTWTEQAGDEWLQGRPWDGLYYDNDWSNSRQSHSWA